MWCVGERLIIISARTDPERQMDKACTLHQHTVDLSERPDLHCKLQPSCIFSILNLIHQNVSTAQHLFTELISCEIRSVWDTATEMWRSWRTKQNVCRRSPNPGLPGTTCSSGRTCKNLARWASIIDGSDFHLNNKHIPRSQKFTCRSPIDPRAFYWLSMEWCQLLFPTMYVFVCQRKCWWVMHSTWLCTWVCC